MYLRFYYRKVAAVRGFNLPVSFFCFVRRWVGALIFCKKDRGQNLSPSESLSVGQRFVCWRMAEREVAAAERAGIDTLKLIPQQ